MERTNIRPAEKRDIARIAEILIFAKRTAYREIFRNDQVSFGEMQVVSLAREYEETEHSLDQVWVFDDGIVKGMMRWGTLRDGQESLELKELYVDPFFQGKGIGKKMMSYFLLEAGKKKVDRVFLWVLEDNRRARHFYETFGCAVQDERTKYPGTDQYQVKYAASLKQIRRSASPFRYLDMERYERKSHFEYFCSLAYPYVGTTVMIDITGFLKKIRRQNQPFFLTFCYCVSRAANQIAEFRQRITRDGRIIEFENCRTSHTVALNDGTYCYCSLDSRMPLDEFLRYAELEQEKARQCATISEDGEEALDKIFLSVLPWISYTSLIQPVPVPADSNPRITWGKYLEQGDKILLPVSVLCHHGLADGRHIAEFYRLLEEKTEELSR